MVETKRSLVSIRLHTLEVRIRRLVQSVGPKPGAELSLSMLISADDSLGTDLKLEKERVRRGIIPLKSRLKGMVPKGFASAEAIRIFRVMRSRRALLVEILPCSSCERSHLNLERIRHHLPDVPFIGHFRSVQVDETIQVPGADEVLAYQTMRVKNVGVYTAKNLRFTVDRVNVDMTFQSLDEGWTWEEAVDVATSQASKIRSILDSTHGSESDD